MQRTSFENRHWKAGRLVTFREASKIFRRIKAGKVRWCKALAIGLAGSGMAAAPMTARAEAGSEADWKASLNQAWEQLSTKQQQELDQEEHEWIKWKNRLFQRGGLERCIQPALHPGSGEALAELPVWLSRSKRVG